MTAQNSNFDTRRTMLSHLTLAGTAALAGSAANAQIIVTSVNQTIGFAPGDLTSFTSSLPGVNQFQIFTAARQIHEGSYFTVTANSIRFRGVGSMQARVAKYWSRLHVFSLIPQTAAAIGSAGGASFNKPIPGTAFVPSSLLRVTGRHSAMIQAAVRTK